MALFGIALGGLVAVVVVVNRAAETETAFSIQRLPAGNGDPNRLVIEGTGPIPAGILEFESNPVSVAGSYISIPVTNQVQAWLNGAPNYGFIVSAASASTSVFFDSKEASATSHPAVSSSGPKVRFSGLWLSG